MSNETKKRKYSIDKPTFDEFHQILKQLAPDQTFTKGSVEMLRTAYFSYLAEVASNLVQHDTIPENSSYVVEACGLNNSPEFVAYVQKAEELLRTTSSTIGGNTRAKSKRTKKIKMTAEMEAEQERLLQKSKSAMAEQRKGP